MTDLDITGLRANDPGLTREALKAERREKAKAGRQAFFAACGRVFTAIGRALPRIILGAILLSIAAAATVFDWYMSGRGWQDLLPGIGVFAYAGAAASVGFWYTGVYKARQELKAGDKVEARIWMAVSGAAFLICILGVGIATITNTGQARQAAQESRRELAQLTARRDQLADKLDVYSVDYWTAMKAADERKLAAQLAIAKGTFDMPNLDIDGACGQKLSFEQRRACVHANGGVDPHTGVEVEGVRAEIERSANGLKQAQDDARDLAELEQKIADFDLRTGDATVNALSGFFKGEDTANGVLLGIFVLLSSLFLFCGGFFGDAVVRMMLRSK